MSTCNDCYHFEICHNFYDNDQIRACTYCENLKDKSTIIDPPAAVLVLCGGSLNGQ